MKLIWRIRWLLTGLILLGVTGAIGIYLLSSSSQPAVRLTATEIREQLLSQYGGEILTLDERRDGYQVTLQAERGVYELLLGGGGEARRIVQLERIEPPDPGPSPDPGSGGEPDSPPGEPGSGEPPQVALTEEEATKLALGAVFGKVEDVDLRSTDSGRYYLIEIETPDDKEVVIQVNAITGAIMSIIWDDDDDDDDDDDE